MTSKRAPCGPGLAVAAFSKGEALGAFLEPTFEQAENLIASAWWSRTLDDKGLAMSKFDEVAKDSIS